MDGLLLDVYSRRIQTAPDWPEISDLLRLFSKIDRIESGCWLWTGAKTEGGYGTLAYGGRRRLAHRVMFALLKNPIPPHLTLDHLCRNRSCINPDHLDPVSLEENVRRGWVADRERPNRNKEKASCPRGHLYDEANTYVDPAGGRKCRRCIREAKARMRLDASKKAREREVARASYHRNKGDRLPPTGERTHCPKGHPYDDANTYLTSNGGRGCRECRRLYYREYRAKRVAARAASA